MAKNIEDVLGPRPQGPQSVEDVLGPRPLYDSRQVAGLLFDDQMHDETINYMADTFAKGWKEGVGPQRFGMAPQTEKWLQENGLFNDYSKGENSLIKNFNATLLKPTATALDLALRAPYGIARGLLESVPAVGAPLTALMEAFPAGHMTGFPVPVTGFGKMIDLRLLEDDPQVARQAATEALDPKQGAAMRFEFKEAPVPDGDTAPAPQVADVNARARMADPETFQAFDPLMDKKNTLETWLRDLRQTETYNIGGREIPAYARLVDEGQGIEREPNANAARVGLIKKLSGDLDEVNGQIAELTPKIQEAYRQAQAPVPVPADPAIGYTMQEPLRVDATLPKVPAEITPNGEGGFDVHAQEGTFHAATLAEATELANKYTPLMQRRPTIFQDTVRQLVDTGRPEAEARANAALVQAYYQARAARFQGALGTPRDLYEAESPDVLRGRPIRGRRLPPRVAGLYDRMKGTIELFKGADASTFVHELGHNWLEDLFRDGAHPEAPPDLLADVQSVKDWLKMKGDKPTERQHELFARGFERFMMEGVAPSPRLAGVFAKFKQWMTSLYRTVANLKAPINDEIRGVYARLLSAPRDEAVIAPDKPLGMDFAEVAERTAAEAKPEEALSKAEEIRTDRDQMAGILRDEINEGRQRAREAKRPVAPAGADETGAAGTGVSEAGTGEPGTDAVREAAAAETGEVGGGGAAAPLEGIPARGNDAFTPAERAGNIRLDNINAPEQVDDVIRATAEANRGFIGERRGTITDGELLDLAEDLGMDAAFLDRKAIGEAFSAQEIVAVRLLLRQSAAKVYQMFQGIKDGSVKPVDLAKEIARNEMIQAKASQAYAEWGRAGHALRSLDKIAGATDIEQLSQFLKENTGRSYEQLLQMAKFGQWLQTPAALNKFVNSTANGKLRQAVVFYWVNSLISGPITHATYALGNGIRAAMDVPITGVAATIGALKGDPARVHFAEVSSSLFGITEGFKNGWTPAWEAVKSGQQWTPPGVRGYMANPYGNYAPAIPGAIGRALGTPQRVVAGIHTFGLIMRWTQETHKLAMRTAINEGLTGPALDARVAKLIATPTEAMMEQAANNAYTEMYMRPGDFMSARNQLARTLHKNVIGEILFPFIKIGVELQRETFLKSTAIGYASPEIRGELLGREGGAAMNEAQAKQLIGHAAVGTGVLAAVSGVTTGYGPNDPDKRAAWLLEHTPYSVEIGSLTIPMMGLGPVGKLMQYGADLHDTYAYWDGKDGEKLAEAFFKMNARAALDESFFRDMGELSDAMNDPGRNGARYILNMVPNILPFGVGVGQVNRQLFDPYSKDVHSIFDALRARVPIASWDVDNRVDMFGNPILARQIHWNRYADDPVAQQLTKLQVGISKVPRRIMNVPLTQGQYHEYAVTAGQLSHQMLAEQLPQIKSAPRGIQALEVKRIIDAARHIARGHIIMKSMGTDNDISAIAGKNKTDLLEDNQNEN